MALSFPKELPNSHQTAGVNWNRWLKTAFNILLPVGLYVVLVRIINLNELYILATRIRISLFTLGLLLAMGFMLFPAFVQSRLLSLRGVLVSAGRIFQLDMISKFYALFLPGDLAGPVIKWQRLYQDDRRGAQIASAIIISRFLSSSAVILVGVMAICADLPFWSVQFPQLTTIIPGVIGLVIVAIWVLLRLYKSKSPSANPFFKKGIAHKVEVKLRKVADAIIEYRADWKILLKLFALLVFFVMINLSTGYLYARAANIEIGFFRLAVYIAITRMVLLLPITLFGIGVREWTLLFLLGQYGVQKEKIILYSMLAILAMLIFCALGGLFEIYEHCFRVGKEGNEHSVPDKA